MKIYYAIEEHITVDDNMTVEQIDDLIYRFADKGKKDFVWDYKQGVLVQEDYYSDYGGLACQVED